MDNKTERKNRIGIISGIALLIVIVSMSGVAGCAGGSTNNTTKKIEIGERIEKTGFRNLTEEEQARKGTYDSAEEKIADMQLVAENGDLALYLEPDYAEFAVWNKVTGDSWFSNPYDFARDTKADSKVKEELQSLISLTYYDSQKTERTMNSYSDCTSKDQYQIEKLDKGFVFHMQIGRVEEKMLAPSVIEVSKYENIILPHVDKKSARKLNAYYTKVCFSDGSLSEAVKKKYLDSMPGLEEHDFYILRDTTEREKKVLEEIIKATEYTSEDMDEDLALSGYKQKKTNYALFKMSLRVELEEGALKVTVPTDLISYDADYYSLGSFQLLRYFGAGKSDQEGYLFVPDGSGALINYNGDGTKKILNTTTSVYGMDYALSFDYGMSNLSSQIYFPVYGNKTEDKAFFAVIREGDALAQIISESGNILSSYETIYPKFNYQAAYTVNYTDKTKISGLYTYVDTNCYTGNYTIQYDFLTDREADYVGMANSYQAYLEKQGVLEKMSEVESKAGFYLEMLGAIERTNTKLGFSYVESVPLTTFEQAKGILEELKTAGDIDLNLRYKGWANGGLYYTVSDKAKVEKSLGGRNGLIELGRFARENQIGFYPDVDFFIVCKDSILDGYNKSFHSARSIRREQLYLTSPQEFTNFAEFQYLNYSISPRYYDKYMKKFFSDYGKFNLSGVSVGTAGSMLYAEYHRTKAITREAAKDILVNGLESYVSDYGLMVDGGNAYTLKYASELVNVPMYHSANTIEDESIPFMQLVLHGYVPYAGEAVNLSGESEEVFLRCIEYGANPFYTVAADNTELLTKTSMTYYYSVKWEELKEEIQNCMEKWTEAYDGCGNQKMTGHQRLTETVSRTEYEDGTVFYVNYGTEDVQLEGGAIVKARSYMKIKK